MASGLVYKYLNEVWKAIYIFIYIGLPDLHSHANIVTLNFPFFMIFVIVTLNPFLVFLHKMYLQLGSFFLIND